MRRLLAICAAAAALATTAAVPTAAATRLWGGVSTWPTNRTVDTSSYDAGTWSYTDRWSDATGANLDGKHREDYYAGLPQADTLTYDAFGAHRSARNGDYYPPNDDARFPELSADVVFVQLRPAGDGLDVRLVFTSLGQRDSSIVTLALATGSGTATSTLPRNAALRCTGCGVERYVTVWGTGSEIATGDGTPVGTATSLAVDVAENVMTFHVPGVATGGPRLRAWLASGLNDGTGKYLTVQSSQSSTAPGGGNGTATNVFDLGFVHENRATVDERVQADLLAKGELGPAQATVDLAALRSKESGREGEPTSGPVEKVLVSSSNEGDGLDTGNGSGSFQNQAAGQNLHYAGRLQGYLVALPPDYRPGRRVPEVMQLHGYNGFYDELYFLNPTVRAAVARGGYLGVYPLGRGDVQYEHDGELDVLEVQQAVEHDYAVDRDRIHLVGISMGGFGGTKMATRHPDVFADASIYVGGEQGDVNFTNDRAAESPVTRAVADVVGNLQDTPMLFGASTADADAAGAAASVVYTQLRQIGDEAHLKQYLLGTHEPGVVDFGVPQMQAMWKRSVRPAVPPRVRYRFDTSWNYQRLVDDGSAWLQGLSPASGTQGTAVAEAYTLPRRLTTLTETMSNGGDPTDRSSYLLRDSLRTTTGARPVSNTLGLTLTGVRTASVDLAGLRVDTGRRYCVDITSDGPAAVRLAGIPLTGLEIAGVPATHSGEGVLLSAPAGSSHAVLAPHGVAAAVGSPCAAGGIARTTRTVSRPTSPSRGQLPATGLATALPFLGAALVLVATRRRRTTQP